MPDIADQLDAAIGAAPTDPPALGPTLLAGRRAMRRRRLAYGVGAAAVALVVGGTTWAVSPGDDRTPRSHEPGIAGDPSTQPPSDARPTDERRERPWVGPDAARLARDGGLEIRPGWEATDRVDRPSGKVLGVEVTRGDRRQWFLWSETTTIASLHAPALGYDSFQEWADVNAPLLDDQVSGGGDDGNDFPGVPRDDLVRWAPDSVSVTRGLVPAADGVTVLDQQHPIDLGASFAPPSDSSAATVDERGTLWYVVARRPDDYIAVRADRAEADHGIDDLDGFVEFARERYAEGGGGLM